jgi:hypothetical protein
MKVLLLFVLITCVSINCKAHPAIGIVKDNRGNIFYTDLKNVWKIYKGNRSLIIPNVHTHELFVDNKDQLYGEGGYYNSKTDKHYHFLWRYRPDGRLDTVIGMREAYLQHDFTLARDQKGNEYYLKRFLPPFSDTTNLYKRTSSGIETVFAEGNFKDVNWIFPQKDNSLLYVSHNSVYRIDGAGNISLVKENIASETPSFRFSENNKMVWGIWQDRDRNIYVAVFSDQTVRKIDTNGKLSDVYKSASPGWTPLSG